MDSELTAAVRELTEVIKQREIAQGEFFAKMIEELRELNVHLRHVEDRLAPRDY
jgi:hypothetical protein